MLKVIAVIARIKAIVTRTVTLFLCSMGFFNHILLINIPVFDYMI